MACFVVLNLAATLGLAGPARPIHVNRGQIVTFRAMHPVDPQRPGARAVVRTEGGGVLYVAEPPEAVVRALCAVGPPG